MFTRRQKRVQKGDLQLQDAILAKIVNESLKSKKVDTEIIHNWMRSDRRFTSTEAQDFGFGISL
jgi:hypothetical protein